MGQIQPTTNTGDKKERGKMKYENKSKEDTGYDEMVEEGAFQ